MRWKQKPPPLSLVQAAPELVIELSKWLDTLAAVGGDEIDAPQPEIDHVRLRQRIPGAENYSKFDTLEDCADEALLDIAVQLTSQAAQCFSRGGVERRFEATAFARVGHMDHRKSITFYVPEQAEEYEDELGPPRRPSVAPTADELSFVALARDDPMAFALLVQYRTYGRVIDYYDHSLRQERARNQGMTEAMIRAQAGWSTNMDTVLKGAADIHRLGADMFKSGLAAKAEHAAAEVEKESVKQRWDTVREGWKHLPTLIMAFSNFRSRGAPTHGSSAGAPSGESDDAQRIAELGRDLARALDAEAMQVVRASGLPLEAIETLEQLRHDPDGVTADDILRFQQSVARSPDAGQILLTLVMSLPVGAQTALLRLAEYLDERQRAAAS